MAVDEAKVNLLLTKLDQVEPKLDAVIQLPAKQRRQGRALIVLAVFVAAIAMVAYSNAVIARHAAAKAQTVIDSQHQSCLSGNDFRAADKQKWDVIIATFQPPTLPNPTPAQAAIRQAQIRAFQTVEDFIAKQDAPRKC